MGEEDEGEDNQSVATTTPEQTTGDFVTEQTTTTEGAVNETLTPDAAEVTEEHPTVMTQGSKGRGDIPAEKKQPVKRSIGKVFKVLKWVPKILHKKKHHIFH